MQADNILGAIQHAIQNRQNLTLKPDHLQLVMAHLNEITESKNELVRENQRLRIVRIEANPLELADIIYPNGATP